MTVRNDEVLPLIVDALAELDSIPERVTIGYSRVHVSTEHRLRIALVAAQERIEQLTLNLAIGLNAAVPSIVADPLQQTLTFEDTAVITPIGINVAAVEPMKPETAEAITAMAQAAAVPDTAYLLAQLAANKAPVVEPGDIVTHLDTTTGELTAHTVTAEELAPGVTAPVAAE